MMRGADARRRVEGDITTARGPTRGGMPDDDVPMIAARRKTSGSNKAGGLLPGNSGKQQKEIKGFEKSEIGNLGTRTGKSENYLGKSISYPVP